jgi:hypothetical protein
MVVYSFLRNNEWNNYHSKIDKLNAISVFVIFLEIALGKLIN